MPAFTSAEATSIRHYLGYPQVYRYQDPRLESAIVQVGGDVDAAALVRLLLTSIDGVFVKVGTSALAGAGVKSLDKGDVELYQGQQLEGMREVGRTFCGRLSSLFGVPILADVFGGGGYTGDQWKLGAGNSSLAGLG